MDIDNLSTFILFTSLIVVPIICFICRYIYFLVFFWCFFNTLDIKISIWKAAFIAALFGNKFIQKE